MGSNLPLWKMDFRRRRVKKHLVLALLLAVTLAACGAPSFRGSVVPEPSTVPDFTLIDQHNEPFRLSDMQGNVVLLFFGYTQCPDVCPTTLATWRQVEEELGPDSPRVRFVFVTVDPERDTPERLGTYINLFNPDFVGLTGTPEQLDAVYRIFGIVHVKNASSGSAAGYTVTHTATAFLLDPAGRWRLLESYGTPPEDIVHDIRQLLK
jgi:protein SCO1/2